MKDHDCLFPYFHLHGVAKMSLAYILWTAFAKIITFSIIRFLWPNPFLGALWALRLESPEESCWLTDLLRDNVSLYCPLQGLAKRVDWTPRQVERWWRRRRQQDKPSQMHRFLETRLVHCIKDPVYRVLDCTIPTYRYYIAFNAKCFEDTCTYTRLMLVYMDHECTGIYLNTWRTRHVACL